MTLRKWLRVFVFVGFVSGCRGGSTATPPPAASTAGLDAAPPIPMAEVVDASSGYPSPSPAQVKGEEAPAGMKKVEGGTFQMGNDTGGEDDEHPAHAMTVASFWLDVTEVTQTAYEECVTAKACPAADAGILSTFGGLFKGPNKPIVGVSWHDAKAYCEWRGKRLPHEAEFERAVRGDDGRRYPWGSDTPTHERTVFETNSPEDVGTHPTGRGPYGHDDLAGNVWEWIDDDYDPYSYKRDGGVAGSCDEINAFQNKLRQDGKQGYTGSNPIPTECEKSIRGGAYNYPANGLRSTNRIHHPPKFRLRMTGLRCAKDMAK